MLLDIRLTTIIQRQRPESTLSVHAHKMLDTLVMRLQLGSFLFADCFFVKGNRVFGY
jgi:hypothetical protein